MKELFKSIEEILRKEALLKVNTEEKSVNVKKLKIDIIDDRFDQIEKLIKSYKNKDEEFYSNLIRILIKHADILYDKKYGKKKSIIYNKNNQPIKIIDDNQKVIDNSHFNHNLTTADYYLSRSLFNYICTILENNKDIKLDINTLKLMLNRNPKLFTLSVEEDYLTRQFNFKRLAVCLKRNETLKKSNIQIDEIYQLLIDTYQIDNESVFPNLINSEQFKENHKKLDDFLETCNSKTFVNITNIIIRKLDENFDRITFIKKKNKENYIENLIISILNNTPTELDYNLIHSLLNDESLNINYGYTYCDYIGKESLLSDLAFTGNAIIIKDLLSKEENIKNCYWSGEFYIELYRLYAMIGEYEKALANFNENYNSNYNFYEDFNEDEFLGTGYTYGEYSYHNSLAAFIKNICNSFKNSDIEYNKKLDIIKEILNHEKVKYIDLQETLPSLKETLNESDYQLLIEALLERESSNNIKFITTKEVNKTYIKYKIEIISKELALEEIKNVDEKVKRLKR